MAESFGSDPERYDRSRPRYPAALIDAIVAACSGGDVLDVGIGTGILARQLRAAGNRVLGVDVDERMAEFARRDGFLVDVARFEDWDTAGRTVDAVLAGQTWHWVDPVAGAAKAAQVLRPGGLFAVFWNAGDPPADLAHAFAAVFREIDPDSLLARAPSDSAVDAFAAVVDRVADGLRQTGAFAEPATQRYPWQRIYTRDEWLDALPTSGAASQLAPDVLARIVGGIGAAIDAVGGSFLVHYNTLALTAIRR
jgi:SAM-dependent methyltransferase